MLHIQNQIKQQQIENKPILFVYNTNDWNPTHKMLSIIFSAKPIVKKMYFILQIKLFQTTIFTCAGLLPNILEMG